MHVTSSFAKYAKYLPNMNESFLIKKGEKNGTDQFAE